MTRSELPQIALIGAARSGTTLLASCLAQHPEIRAPHVKEPNFFTSNWDRGWDWYQGLFAGQSGHLTIDASASYSSPAHEQALPRLAEASPSARMVYIVRHPLERVESQYHHEAVYMNEGDGPQAGANVLRQAMQDYRRFVLPSRYDVVIDQVSALFGEDRLLVVPFEAVSRDPVTTAGQVLRWLGLDVPDTIVASDLFRNERTNFRSPVASRGFNALRKSPLYPKVRAALGPERTRWIRKQLTAPVRSSRQPAAAEWDGTSQELSLLVEVQREAATAVRSRLSAQDADLDLGWLQQALWLEEGNDR